LLKTAELANKIRHADDFGLTVPSVDVDYAKVVGRSRKVATKFERGVTGLFKKYGVTLVFGNARLASADTVEVTAADGTTSTISAKHVVIATGARARTFPGITPDGERILTYREAIVRTEQPARVTVLGAGAIGMEFAYFWNAMGTAVTVVEGRSEVLPVEDADCGAVVRKSMKKSGVTFKLGTLVQEVRREGDETVTVLNDGTELRADLTLVALGITPNTSELGLEQLGIRLSRGFIEVDESCSTNIPGVYAVGDVTTKGGLAHTATAQGHMCAERIAGHHAPAVDYDSIPGCTYCQPQVASVGLTEEQARAKGLRFTIGRFPFVANGKAQGAGAAEGFVKVLVGEQYGEILGAHIVGAAATEMIAEFTLARTSESTADVVMNTVHAHPTYSEAMFEAVAQARGASVHI
jgi:dihydrolipoamide dehydrogenase